MMFSGLRILSLSLILLSWTGYLHSQSVIPDSMSVSPFGKVNIYSSHPRDAKNVIIMISGDGGWKYGVPEFAKEFSKTNSVVIGVDILKYYRHLRQLDSECYTVWSDFVELATEVEHKYNFAEYIPPVIMGYSSGATLVYGILSQARPGTFMGGISLGFCPDIELPKMLCQLNGLKATEMPDKKGFFLLPDEKLGNPWIVLNGKKDKICDFQSVNDFVLKTGNAKLIALPEVGHGFSNWSDFMPEWKAAFSDLIGNYRPKNPIPVKDSVVNRMPYIITREKASAGRKMMAVLFSGDGGWYSFEQSISDRLANYGIPVIGIDTKKYFWKKKTPEKTAADLAELIRYFSNEWGKTEYMIIGYSLGAEIIPIVYNKLPDDVRRLVKSEVMLSPTPTTDLEIHVTDMMGLGNKANKLDVVSAISENKECRQIIIFGANEKTKFPELLNKTSVVIVTIPGDHHYKRDTGLIVQKMKDNEAF